MNKLARFVFVFVFVCVSFLSSVACYCPDGYHWNGTTCVRDTPQPTKPPEPTKPAPETTEAPTDVVVTEVPAQDQPAAAPAANVISDYEAARAQARMAANEALANLCVGWDLISVDNGEDILWFWPQNLVLYRNITLDLTGKAMDGSFNPNNPCHEMAFEFWATPESDPEIWVHDNGDNRPILYQGQLINGKAPAWSRDGIIAFSSFDEGRVMFTDRDGSFLTETQVTGVYHLDWSPDGKYLEVSSFAGNLFLSKEGEIVAGLDYTYHNARWSANQEKVCDMDYFGVTCSYLNGQKDGYDWKWGRDLAFQPKGEKTLFVDTSGLHIQPTNQFRAGDYHNPDWFSQDKAEWLPIQFSPVLAGYQLTSE